MQIGDRWVTADPDAFVMMPGIPFWLWMLFSVSFVSFWVLFNLLYFGVIKP